MKGFLRILLLSIACSLFSACTTNKENTDVGSNSVSTNIPSLQPTSYPLSEKDIARRNEVEQMMLRGEYLHDGPSEMREIGDINSVPALLVVLKKNPPYKNGTMQCTTAHGLTALRKLTGANPGITYEEWEVWWEKYKLENEIPRR